MKVACWFHTVNVPDGEGGWRATETVYHDYTRAELSRLLELFSFGDWEDGPRCLRGLLGPGEEEQPEPRRWISDWPAGHAQDSR